MKKVLVEKCTPQQARVDLKNKSKPVNKPKTKPTKVPVPTVTDTADIENVNNLVLFSYLFWVSYPKGSTQKLK